MPNRFAELLFTSAVKQTQVEQGSRAAYERLEAQATPAQSHLGRSEREFIAERDSFYLATVSETGWPYIQHRGGPKGFLRVLDEGTLAFADYRGNRQYISVGNTRVNDRVALFLMDYSKRRRLKILGRLRAVSINENAQLFEQLRIAGYRALIERAMVIRLEGFDWNCPQHITTRFTQAEALSLFQAGDSK